MSDDKDKIQKLPPSWGPGTKTSLRTWTEDLKLWMKVSDLPPKKIVPSIIYRLEGLAKNIGMDLTDTEMELGGYSPWGHPVGPLELLLSRLQNTFGHLDEEIQMNAGLEYDQFRRLPHESIDSLIVRFEMMRLRVAKEAGIIKPWSDYAKDLMGHANVDHDTFRELTKTMNYRLPTTKDTYGTMVINMRRLKHITENAPLNLAASLRGSSQARSQYFISYDTDGNPCGDVPENVKLYLAKFQEKGEESLPSNLGGSSSSSSAPNSHECVFPVASNSNVNNDRNPQDASSMSDESEWSFHEEVADTESATSSDDNEPLSDSDTRGLQEPAQTRAIYLKYARAKKAWRRHTGKPTRKARRFMKRSVFSKKRRSSNRPRTRFSKKYSRRRPFLRKWRSYLSDQNATVLIQNAKRGGKKFGRKGNPVGKDGKTLTCHTCGSTEHFKRDCPKGNSSAPSFPVNVSSGTQESTKPWETQARSSTTQPYQAGGSTLLAVPKLEEDDDVMIMGSDNQWGTEATQYIHTIAFAHGSMVKVAPWDAQTESLEHEHDDYIMLMGSDDQWGTTDSVHLILMMYGSAQPSQEVYMAGGAQTGPSVSQYSYPMPYAKRDDRYAQFNPPDAPAIAMSQVKENIASLSKAFTDKLKQEEMKELMQKQRDDDLHQYRTNRVQTVWHHYDDPAVRSMSPIMTPGVAVTAGTTPQPAEPPRQCMPQHMLQHMPTQLPPAMSQQQEHPHDFRMPSNTPPWETIDTAFRDVRHEARLETFMPGPGSVVTHRMYAVQQSLDDRQPPMSVIQRAEPGASSVLGRSEAIDLPTPTQPHLPQGFLCSHCFDPNNVPNLSVDTDTCVWCSTEFKHGENVARLRCRHQAHEKCWLKRQMAGSSSLLSTHSHMNCPGCHGHAIATCVYKYIGKDTIAGQIREPNTVLPLNSVSREEIGNYVSREIDFHMQQFFESQGRSLAGKLWNTFTRDMAEKSHSFKELLVAPMKRLRRSGSVPLSHRFEQPALTSGTETNKLSSSARDCSPMRGRQTASAAPAPHEISVPHTSCDATQLEERRNTHGQNLSHPIGSPESLAPVFQGRDCEQGASIANQARPNQSSIPGSAFVIKDAVPSPNATEVVHSVYHMNVKLADGRLALTADIGSKANACGENWAREAVKIARQHGHRGEIKKRAVTLRLEGVGHGSQTCEEDVIVTGAVPTIDGSGFKCQFQGPIIPDSDVPALFGLEPMSALNTVIDCRSKRLHFLPTGDGSWERELPPGTRTVQGELSPTGHLMIPFAEYVKLGKRDLAPQVNLHSVAKKSKAYVAPESLYRHCCTCNEDRNPTGSTSTRFCFMCGDKLTRLPGTCSPTLSPTEPVDATEVETDKTQSSAQPLKE